MPTRLDIARPDIVAHFDEAGYRVYNSKELGAVLSELRGFWRLAQSTTVEQFAEYLEKKARLRICTLISDLDEAQLTRYAWLPDREAPVSPFALGTSLRGGAYLSHASALYLHGLTDQLPATLYVNKEQSPKGGRSGELTQAGLDRAFARPQRASRLTYRYEDWRFVVLSGKHTRRLGVVTLPGPQGEPLALTGLERTLIDAVVRPVYAGGPAAVLAAFEAAGERLADPDGGWSVGRMLATLKRLDYMYPYHQAIGFYMDRAGYPTSSLDRLRRLGLELDFYLVHAIPPEQREHDPEWRVYYPKGL